MDMPFFELFIHAAHAAEAVHETAEKSSGIAALGVNGTLFVAQLINFSLVFLVLWRWVFRPIAAHLEERSAKIEQSLQDAADIRAQKETVATWKAEQVRDAKKEAADIIGKAKQEAELLRQEVLAKAKVEQGALMTAGQQHLEREQEVVVAEAEKRLAELVVLATEKVLREKLNDVQDKKLVAEAVKAVTTHANRN